MDELLPVTCTKSLNTSYIEVLTFFQKIKKMPNYCLQCEPSVIPQVRSNFLAFFAIFKTLLINSLGHESRLKKNYAVTGYDQ